MKKKVMAAGHICVDITPEITGGAAGQMQILLSPGKLTGVGKADIHTGGAVANTGLAMKILGADVSLAGKIGDDAFGRMVQEIVSKYDAQDGLIVREDESTSYSVVLAIPGVDRIFLHHSGANDTFCAEDLDRKRLEETALFHFGYPPLMKRVFEENGKELVKIMRLARECGAATSMDMAAVDPNSEAGRSDWNAILKRTLPFVDFFVPSVEELTYMIDRDKYDRLNKLSGAGDFTEVLDLERDVVPLAKQCMSMGVGVLLIKCGAPGIYYCTADEKRMESISKRIGLNAAEWADKSGFERSYVPERILSGTGAGDTSIAAFLTAVLDGCPPEKCMQYAVATGACCVSAYDALSGLKTFPELEEKISAGWAKNGKGE